MTGSGGTRTGKLRALLVGLIAAAWLVLGGSLVFRAARPGAASEGDPPFQASTFAFSDGCELVVVGPGAAPRVLVRLRGCFDSILAPVWSPDGRTIAFVLGSLPRPAACVQTYTVADGPSGLRFVLEGLDLERGFTPDGTREGVVPEPTILSGEQSLAESQRRGAEIYTVNADGSGCRLLRSGLSVGAGYGMDWSPDGDTLLYTSEDRLFALDRAHPDSPAVPLLKGRAGSFGPDMDSAPGFQGFIAYQDKSFHIFVVRLDAPGDGRYEVGKTRHLIWGDELQDSPAISPDGRHIALLEGPRAGAHRCLCVVEVQLEADGTVAFGPSRQLVEDKSLRGPLAWSPDGTCITFAMHRQEQVPLGPALLYRANLQGNLSALNCSRHEGNRPASARSLTPAESRLLGPECSDPPHTVEQARVSRRRGRSPGSRMWIPLGETPGAPRRSVRRQQTFCGAGLPEQKEGTCRRL